MSSSLASIITVAVVIIIVIIVSGRGQSSIVEVQTCSKLFQNDSLLMGEEKALLLPSGHHLNKLPNTVFDFF